MTTFQVNKTNVVELYEKRKTEIEKEANDSLKSLEKMISQSEAARDKKESNLRSVISGLNAEESFQTDPWNPVDHGLLKSSWSVLRAVHGFLDPNFASVN